MYPLSSPPPPKINQSWKMKKITPSVMRTWIQGFLLIFAEVTLLKSCRFYRFSKFRGFFGRGILITAPSQEFCSDQSGHRVMNIMHFVVEGWEKFTIMDWRKQTSLKPQAVCSCPVTYFHHNWVYMYILQHTHKILSLPVHHLLAARDLCYHWAQVFRSCAVEIACVLA
jgi:hypothetical protein